MEKMLTALNKCTKNGKAPLIRHAFTAYKVIPRETGLCHVAGYTLTCDEYDKFCKYLYEKFPDKGIADFIWNAGEAKPRIEWLKKQIKILEHEE